METNCLVKFIHEAVFMRKRILKVFGLHVKKQMLPELHNVLSATVVSMARVSAQVHRPLYGLHCMMGNQDKGIRYGRHG